VTGQYPRRRESDTQARRRVAALHRRDKAHRAAAVPISEALYRFHLPRISAAGRLIGGA
jgi:hypothetical protein